jgi:aminopeptidase-like protein
MADAQLQSLPNGDYDVVMDTELRDGHLTYGEYLHQGESTDEVLLSAHICHPSLANDNCSGLALLSRLAAALSNRRTRYSYRFIFAPGTIGAITWLARNEANLNGIKAGLVVSCVGDGGGPVYKRSRRGDALIDKAMAHVLQHTAPGSAILDFSPYGYDERQYCSPGFNLPVGLFQRSQFGTFAEYHTSADNMDFIKPEHLATSFGIVAKLIEVLENDETYVNLFPKGEPQLGRRGLYTALGGDKDAPAKSMAMLWVLNLSDGEHSLLDIAARSNMPFAAIHAAADLLTAHGLLARAERG